MKIEAPSCTVCGGSAEVETHTLVAGPGGTRAAAPLCGRCAALFEHGRLNVLPFLDAQAQAAAVIACGSIERAYKLLGGFAAVEADGSGGR
jgi:hypothetical protein